MLKFDIYQMAQASGLTEANIVMLMNRMPELFPDDQVAKGHGKKRCVSVNGLRRVAFVGAIASIGVGPTQAAKFVITFLDTLSLRHWATSCLDPISPEKARRETDRFFLGGNFTKMAFFNCIFCDGFVDYSNEKLSHKEIDDITFNSVMEFMEKDEKYDLYEEKNGDVILTISDGCYVTVNIKEESEFIEAFQMKGWERGADLIFKDIFKMEDKDDISSTMELIKNCSVKILINLSAITRQAYMRSVL
ncbi:hypothetical protein [Acetobacter malorum]|uniref:hypothetical protein n=1 Tax=Acetobacter malorum TaxID=178901 RepID=UPI0039EC64A5